MYKIFITVFFLTCSYMGAQAQAVLTNAILYYQDGDQAKAKTAIDEAIKTEKAQHSAKGWYYRGMIYKAISEKEIIDGIYSSAQDTAVASFIKSKAFDKPAGEFQQMSDLRLQEQWATATNEGVKLYQGAYYKESIHAFKIAHIANPSDTTALLYGSYAAVAGKNMREAYLFCTALKQNKYNKAYVFKTCADYYLDSNLSTKAQNELEEGLRKNPNDPMLLQSLANIYLSTHQTEKAIGIMEQLEKAKPDDVIILTNIAVQYQKLDQVDKAESYYKKVLAKDPENYVSLFNLGGLYVDKGRSAMNKYNTLTQEQNKKEGNQLKAEMNTYFSKASEYSKQALLHADNTEDQTKLNQLIHELDTITKTINK